MRIWPFGSCRCARPQLGMFNVAMYIYGHATATMELFFPSFASGRLQRTDCLIGFRRAELMSVLMLMRIRPTR